jgi:GTP-binding protein HflX
VRSTSRLKANPAEQRAPIGLAELGSFASKGQSEAQFSRCPRTVVVALQLGRFSAPNTQEICELAASAGAQVVATVVGKRDRPDPALFVGSGKAEEIRQFSVDQGVELVVFDHELSAAQQRNLQKVLGRRVIDRVALILDIFALRAQSHEGKLQVELAQLDYLSARLVRGWTHLERQRGGIGLRGPGETQLETDRRLLGQRVKQLKLRLAGLDRQRLNRRRGRGRDGSLKVSLVGYTNAGKSTIFNGLTHAGVLAMDQLFATLDTTSRRVFLAPGQYMVLSDTVGFIRALPHSLIQAFKSTLQEAAEADLLLHVIDAADPERHAHEDAVNQVLGEIGAGDVPRIQILNKADLLQLPCRLEQGACGSISRVWISAAQGQGLDLVRRAVASFGWPSPAPDTMERDALDGLTADAPIHPHSLL